MDEAVRQFVAERVEMFKRELAVEIESRLEPDEHAELRLGYSLSVNRQPRVEIVVEAASSDKQKPYRCDWQKGQRREVSDEKVSLGLIREVLKLNLREHERKAAEALLANNNQELTPDQLREMGFADYLDFEYFKNSLRKSGLKVMLRPVNRNCSWSEQSYRFFCVKQGTISLPMSERYKTGKMR